MSPQLTFAPVHFPIYGLARAAPSLRRWLHYVNGGDGRLNAVVLAHGAAAVPSPQIEWVAVTSSVRTVVPDGNDGWVALDTALDLTQLAQPKLPARKRDRYESAAAQFATDVANDRALWNEVEWSVNGQPIPAFTMRFAGAWGGFTTSGGVNVSVVSTRPIADIALATVQDSRAYAFDATEPVEFPDSFVRSQADTLGEAATFDPSWPTHPDHARLIGA